jgi:tRNA pseudouridine38-40 synthase
MNDRAEPPLEGGSLASGTPVPAGSGRVRLRLDVAYDGSAYHGFAENRGVRTVAGDLRAAVERVVGHPVRLSCAGRTDTGVHARGQVVTLDVVDTADPVALRDSLVAQLGPAVVVRGVRVVSPDFDARFSARARTYRYRVLDSEVPDPFLAATSWWVSSGLDRAALREACPPLLGEHDFSSFCRRPKAPEEVSLVRRVLAADWSEPDEDLLEFEITATAFCHQMVRSVVGLLVDVGRGRRTPADVTAALVARDRSKVPSLAPPRGLVLWHVEY